MLDGRVSLAGVTALGRKKNERKEEKKNKKKAETCKRQKGVMDFTSVHANINDILSFKFKTHPMGKPMRYARKILHVY